jgi:hypothetical protein
MPSESADALSWTILAILPVGDSPRMDADRLLDQAVTHGVVAVAAARYVNDRGGSRIQLTFSARRDQFARVRRLGSYSQALRE